MLLCCFYRVKDVRKRVPLVARSVNQVNFVNIYYYCKHLPLHYYVKLALRFLINYMKLIHLF